MALDYISVGISLVILIFYLMVILLLFEIKKRMIKEFETSFVYMVAAVIFLAIRRVQQVFVTSQIIESIPYLADIITFIFATLILLSFFSFYKVIKNIKAPETKKQKKSAMKEKIEQGKKPGKYVYLDLTK